jgi:hypothetical protein
MEYLSDHGMKLEISIKKKTEKFTNMWKSNNTLLTQPMLQRTKENSKKIKENL